mmetsp:Transcript_61962/g.73440  ORF Transcript_61962/g.73440 Transcript_61962/m.73440 type:complete len:333 (-) Transcript_61962:3-1001(-)
MARRWLWHKSFDQGAVFILVGLIAITAIFQILFITKTRNMDVDPSQIFFQHPNPPRTTPAPSPPPPPPTPPPTTTSPILSLIKKAIGNDHDINSLLTSTSHLHHLPSLTEVNHLYTSTPHIHGLETCPTYRAAIPKHLRFIAPAGTMNTGTNLLSSLLHRNCHIPSPLRRDPPKTREAGIRFQAPWGKHHPPSYRNENVASDGGAGVIQDHVLPVVMIKDPLTWMSSMCVHRYGTVLEGGGGGAGAGGSGGVGAAVVGFGEKGREGRKATVRGRRRRRRRGWWRKERVMNLPLLFLFGSRRAYRRSPITRCRHPRPRRRRRRHLRAVTSKTP